MGSISEFNEFMMGFVSHYNCKMEVDINEDGMYVYNLGSEVNWNVLFLVHPTGVVLKISYSCLPYSNVYYDVFYDIAKSSILYDSDNYAIMQRDVKKLIDTIIDGAIKERG